ncbi:retrotransposable element Tf2, partial [Tanacetum coccineum]
LMALDKWRGYMLDRYFKIKTDHFGLKYLLNQRLTTPFQTKWLPKLLGFDYEISYNKGTKNIVADALSRINNDNELNAMVLSTGGVFVHVKECDACQRSKFDLAAYPGFLQPLPIPERIWTNISMDFIVGLPKSQGKSIIFVVVDMLIYKLHGLPDSIVSDRDNVFLSHFWQSLFRILKVELKLSTLSSQNRWTTSLESVDRSLQARENAIEMFKFHIKRSQDRMKKYADLKRSEREFDVGMWVYLKLKPHRQVTIRQATQNKLSPKYYGPFMIVAKIGVVAYKLDLLSGGQVKWVNHDEEDATWELVEDLLKRFPDFSLDP